MGNMDALRPLQAPSKVVFTGVSSFTGTWFAATLAQQGHHVIGILSRDWQEYSEERRQRLAWLSQSVELVDNAPMGSNRFKGALASVPTVDLACWHHAVVGDYTAADFPLGRAIAQGTQGARASAQILADRGCVAAVITRSVFESGQGSPPNGPPIGLYAVAKRAVSETLALEMARVGIRVGDFVVCNPVGPLEGPRLTSHLLESWLQGKSPELKAPRWLRDNIPVDLLSQAYTSFVGELSRGTATSVTPSFWPLSNADWALKIAREFGSRLRIETPVSTSAIPNLREPEVRIGLDTITPSASWSESSFWDEYAHFYQHLSRNETGGLR